MCSVCTCARVLLPPFTTVRASAKIALVEMKLRRVARITPAGTTLRLAGELAGESLRGTCKIGCLAPCRVAKSALRAIPEAEAFL